MAKPRTCPNCHNPIPVGQGYRFDEQNNMICDSCGKIVYPATKGTSPLPPPGKIYGPWQQEQPDPEADAYHQH